MASVKSVIKHDKLRVLVVNTGGLVFECCVQNDPQQNEQHSFRIVGMI